MNEAKYLGRKIILKEQAIKLFKEEFDLKMFKARQDLALLKDRLRKVRTRER